MTIKSSFSITTGRGRTTSAARNNQIMIEAIKGALINETTPDIQTAYNFMTSGWEAQPEFKFSVKAISHGTMLSWVVETPGNKDAGLKWAMVDTEGRAGGKPIFAKVKFRTFGFEKTVLGWGTSFDIGGKGYKKKYGKLGEIGTVAFKGGQVGYANRPPLHFLPEYAPKTFPVGFFGGPGVKSGNWKSAMVVKQGAVKPRFLTVTNIMPALRGKTTPVSNFIEPIVGRKVDYRSPVRRAYRNALTTIAREALSGNK